MLAIIIPYFKLTYFEETLKSLENQTDKRFKVYIGDDASPEDPSDLINKYHDKFEIIYHRFHNNLGSISLAKQWERCIALTEAEEWLMILGDDDFIGDTVVASWYENYDLFHNKANIIRFATKIIDERTQTVSDPYTHPFWETATDSFLRKYHHQTRSSLSEYIFSRTSFLKHGFYDYPLAWNSDDRAWLDFSDNKPIFTINEGIVLVRISTLNISGKTDNIGAKCLSGIAFYKFMISNKLGFYNKQQRERLMRQFESEVVKVRNIGLLEWFFLLFFYLKYFDFDLFKKFIKRFLNSILKRHES